MPYAGGHQRREELARAKGFGSYREYRKAGAAARAAATSSAVQGGAYRTNSAGRQAMRQVRAGATAPVTARQRRFDLGGGDELVRSMNPLELYAALRRADVNDKVVRAVVTVRVPADGSRRTVNLWQKGGWAGDRAYAAALTDGVLNVIAGGVNDAYDLGVGAADIEAIDLHVSDD